jgi:hypothetical protein
VAVPRTPPDPAHWEPITLDEIREAIDENQLNAGLDRLGAKTAAAAERYRAAGHPVTNQA